MARRRLSSVFAPKEREFFDLFDASAANLLRAVELLDELLQGYPDSREKARDVLLCEQEGDRITYEIIQRLNTTFVTPVDREDVIAMASALDDVVDFTEETADLLGLYKIEAPMEQAQHLARILHEAARALASAVPLMRSFGDVSAQLAEVHRLENEGDTASREAVASLFDTGIDPMVVIRWKDIFERLEDGIDATERAANVLSGIVLKNR
jgi:predicted phosphate transport protein (TIGR00153 family)